MAIPISEYIDIRSTIVPTGTGERDFSGLVFTQDTMNTVTELEAEKTDYDEGKPVAITRYNYSDLFSTTSDTYKFASKYFSYLGGNKNVKSLYVVKLEDADKLLDSYKSAIKNQPNFGSFTFLGGSDVITQTNLKTVAAYNATTDYLMVIAVANGTLTNAYDGLAMTHVVITGDTDEEATNTAAWMPMAWYASVDYARTDASATIDYKQFSGEEAAVTELNVKTSTDKAHMNYLGLVQTNGRNIRFYQTGVNCDGNDTGVIRDKVWIEGEIKAGWIDLSTSSQKVPANATGAAMVENMIMGVVTTALSNGSILVDKALTTYQTSKILDYSNNDSNAVSSVQTDGYYLTTEITVEDGKYICQYILIYAKGDHVSKVEGTHYLV